MNGRPDGRGGEIGDFLSLDPARVLRMAMRRQCAVCGHHVAGQEYAFLSGEKSAAQLVSANPPAHEGCLHAALVLCPYVALERTRRATGARAAHLDTHDLRLDPRKPRLWLLGVTASYQVETHPDGSVLIRHDPWLRQRRFRYGGGLLTEAPW